MGLKQLVNALTVREYFRMLHLVLLELALGCVTKDSHSPARRGLHVTRLTAEMERLDRAKVDVWVKDQREHQNDGRIDVLEAIE